MMENQLGVIEGRMRIKVFQSPVLGLLSFNFLLIVCFAATNNPSPLSSFTSSVDPTSPANWNPAYVSTTPASKSKVKTTTADPIPIDENEFGYIPGDLPPAVDRDGYPIILEGKPAELLHNMTCLDAFYQCKSIIGIDWHYRCVQSFTGCRLVCGREDRFIEGEDGYFWCLAKQLSNLLDAHDAGLFIS